MEFYIIRALFPALIIDILLTISFLNKGINALAAFVSVLLYSINAYVWALILRETNSSFSGQGALGLAMLIYIGIAFSILRLIFGIILVLYLRYR